MSHAMRKGYDTDDDSVRDEIALLSQHSPSMKIEHSHIEQMKVTQTVEDHELPFNHKSGSEEDNGVAWAKSL